MDTQASNQSDIVVQFQLVCRIVPSSWNSCIEIPLHVLGIPWRRKLGWRHASENRLPQKIHGRRTRTIVYFQHKCNMTAYGLVGP